MLYRMHGLCERECRGGESRELRRPTQGRRTLCDLDPQVQNGKKSTRLAEREQKAAGKRELALPAPTPARSHHSPLLGLSVLLASLRCRSRHKRKQQIARKQHREKPRKTKTVVESYPSWHPHQQTPRRSPSRPLWTSSDPSPRLRPRLKPSRSPTHSSRASRSIPRTPSPRRSSRLESPTLSNGGPPRNLYRSGRAPGSWWND
jgi:hypothetical protein